MKIVHFKAINHIIYWIFVVAVLTLTFGRSWDSPLHAFYFISMLLPIVMGTSYFFNYVLVPRYLLKGRKLKFTIYLLYMFIVSLYLEFLVLLFSLSYLANFHFNQLPPNVSDIQLLSLVLYLIVFVASFFVMMQQWKASQKELLELKIQQGKSKRSFLEITSQRKTIHLPFDEIRYIESLADYVNYVTKDNEFNSKEAITRLESRLPGQFIRIHRSFIVNMDKISSIGSNEICIGNTSLPIGRSYKKKISKKVQKR